MPEHEPGAPVRVLFVYDHLGYPGGATHGLTRYCLTVLPRLDPSLVQVTACFLREEHPAAAELREAGVAVRFLGRGPRDPRALSDVLRVIREEGVQVVHAAGQKGVLAGRTAARIAGVRVLVHLHDMTPPRPLVGSLLRATAGWTDKAIGVSRAVAEHAAGPTGTLRGHPVSVLYNGFDAGAFTLPEGGREGSAWRESQGFGEGDRLIGVIGRLSPEKGQERLLRILPALLERLPSVRLVVVGDGPLASDLRRQTRELGVENAIRFAGQQGDMATVLAALDVVAIPSSFEGLSFVALEAMAAGVPVVANAVGGVREVLDDGACGILVDPDDDTAMREALLGILLEPGSTVAMLERARERALEFSLERHLAALEELYVRLGRGEPEFAASP